MAQGKSRASEIATRLKEILRSRKSDGDVRRTENVNDTSTVDASKKGMPEDPGFDTPSTVTGKGGATVVE